MLPLPEEVPALVPARTSVTWRMASDIRLMGASGYALVLQVAHPTVGAGVAEHSNFAADPWGRLLRTLDYVHGTIYGGPRRAGEIGRRIREMHKSINGVRPDGRPYHALEPVAFAWVHATLASAIVDGHATFGSPMTAAQIEEFWADWLRLGRLIGVRQQDLPAEWAGFRPYFDDVVDTQLQDNPTVHEVLRTLREPARPPVPGLNPGVWRVLRLPAAKQLELFTLGLLPDRLRRRLNLRWTGRDERAFRALAAASRAASPVIVGPLREFGPAYLRWRGWSQSFARFLRSAGETADVSPARAP